MSDDEMSAELQFDLKKLEFSPQVKQCNRCVALIEQLDVFSPNFDQILKQIKIESAHFFELILPTFQ